MRRLRNKATTGRHCQRKELSARDGITGASSQGLERAYRGILLQMRRLSTFVGFFYKRVPMCVCVCVCVGLCVCVCVCERVPGVEVGF